MILCVILNKELHSSGSWRVIIPLVTKLHSHRRKRQTVKYSTDVRHLEYDDQCLLAGTSILVRNEAVMHVGFGKR